MAILSGQPSAGAHAQSSPQPATARATNGDEDALSTSPVEMRTMSTSPPEPTAAITATQTATTPQPSIQQDSVLLTPDARPSETTPLSAEPSMSPKPAPPTNLLRSETEAIGPSTDTPAANPDNTNGPVLVIMLLLTTGARHPYKIDEKYLKKRNVSIDDMDPYNISVYTLKELIWRDWREEWEPRPTSPVSIRLIHFGRMLDDKSPLRDCRFQTEAPNVVHMTVKPQEVIDEEDTKTGKGGSRRDGDEESHAGCRCVIL